MHFPRLPHVCSAIAFLLGPAACTDFSSPLPETVQAVLRPHAVPIDAYVTANDTFEAYLNYPNRMTVFVAGIPADAIAVKPQYGTVEKIRTGLYVWTVDQRPPNADGTAELTVYSTYKRVIRPIASQTFRLKPLPTPEVAFCGQTGGKLSLNQARSLDRSDSFGMRLPHATEAAFRLNTYTLSVIRGGRLTLHRRNLDDACARLQPGDTVLLGDFRLQRAGRPARKSLQVLRFAVTD